MKKNRCKVSAFLLLLASCAYEEPTYNPIRNVEGEESETGALPFEEFKEGDDINLAKDWDLYWNDEFVGGDKEFDARWNAENYASGHIDCGRFRENAVVSDGTLKIVYKHEYRAGKEWTTANVMTKEKFLYGYFEARYKYAPAYATNNSFWIRTDEVESKGSTFEIDINEGKYPNIVATNYADTQTSKSDAKAFIYGSSPIQKIMHETGKVKYRYFKLVSNQGARFHIQEFCAFPALDSYPDLNKPYDTWTPEQKAGDYAYKAKVESSDAYAGWNGNTVDRKVGTTWCSKDEGEKWLIFDLGQERTISCFLFLSGSTYGASDPSDPSTWVTGLLNEYKIYGSNDKVNWTEVVSKENTQNIDFSKEYHTFGLEWNEDFFAYYVDRKMVRKIENNWCYSPATIFVSGAVVLWAGEITDALDGATMEVDYVRIYKKKSDAENEQTEE